MQQQTPATPAQAEPPPAPVAEAPPPVPAEPPPAPVAETAAAPEPSAPATPEPLAVEADADAEAAKETATLDSPLVVTTDYDTEYKDPLMELVTDSRILGVGALIIVFLGVLFGIRSWRNRRSDLGLDTFSQDATSMFPGESTSIFGDNGGQSVDTSASSVIHTDFSQTGLSIDTNEGVDPVAEADVYMAYGRDSQAEEILNDALKADPKRGAIYVKLLEIYAQRQDLTKFEATASELFSRTEGQGRDWEKAAQMGRRLDSSNPLYSGGAQARRDKPELSKLPGLEPMLEEPSRMDMDEPLGPPSVSSGPALSDLDFGTSQTATKKTATNAGKMDDTMLTRVVASTVSMAQASLSERPVTGMPVDGISTEVDFEFEPAEDEPKAAGSLDFDLGKQQQAVSEAGKQPISVTVSRKAGTATVVSKAANDLAKQLDVAAGTASKKAGSKTVSPKASNELGKSFGLDSVHEAATRTVTSPARDDEVTLDLEKTGFDPKALDFDLDLDLKPDAAAAAIAPKGNNKGKPTLPITDPIGTLEAGEIDTKLELALAYRDMGDNEGALELLREVVAQGNAAQKAEAKALIANLG